MTLPAASRSWRQAPRTRSAAQEQAIRERYGHGAVSISEPGPSGMITVTRPVGRTGCMARVVLDLNGEVRSVLVH